MKLIPNWRKAWRFWSIRLSAMGTALTAALVAFPDAAVQAWAFLPAEFKSAIPPKYIPLAGVVLLVASMVARIIKQASVEDAERN